MKIYSLALVGVLSIAMTGFKKPAEFIQLASGAVMHTNISNDGKRIFVDSLVSSSVFDAETGAKLFSFPSTPIKYYGPSDVGFSICEGFIASPGEFGKDSYGDTRLYDSNTGELLNILRMDLDLKWNNDFELFIKLKNDCSQVFVGVRYIDFSGTKPVFKFAYGLFDANSGARLTKNVRVDFPLDIAVSDDLSVLATNEVHSPELRLIDVKSSALIFGHDFPEHWLQHVSLAFSSDSKTLLVWETIFEADEKPGITQVSSLDTNSLKFTEWTKFVDDSSHDTIFRRFPSNPDVLYRSSNVSTKMVVVDLNKHTVELKDPGLPGYYQSFCRAKRTDHFLLLLNEAWDDPGSYTGLLGNINDPATMKTFDIQRSPDDSSCAMSDDGKKIVVGSWKTGARLYTAP